MASATDSTEFFRQCAYIFHWADLADKTVMDIGCGKGEGSTRKFMELYPNMGKLIAIDNYAEVIDYAQRESQHPKIEYHQADILEWSSVSQWEGQMHVIVSYYCFNCIDDKVKAFENVYRLLATGGTAAIVFTLQADFYDWGKEVGEMYSEYLTRDVNLEAPESHTNNHFASVYQRNIALIGFDILQCDDEYLQMTFYTEEDCKRYLSSVCSLTPMIPSHLKDRFLEDIFQAFLKYRPVDQEGLLAYRYRVAKILVKKSEILTFRV